MICACITFASSNVSRSVFSDSPDIPETMDGADIIRVFGRLAHFRQMNYTNLSRNVRAFMAVLAVDLWLVLRLSLVSM